MRYISFFSGIGGFEIAIHEMFKDAECVGYSEIKEHAISVYKHHFPSHKNLGNITEIKPSVLKKINCDMVVAGFPCTNLSSLACINGVNKGLEGDKSKLFYNLVKALKILKKNNPNLHIILENNASMSKKNKEIITIELQKIFKIHTTTLNSDLFGVQSRNRIYWTTFPVKVPETGLTTKTWKDILIPLKDAKNYTVNEKFIKVANTVSGKGGENNVKIFVEKNDDDTYSFKKERNVKDKTRWMLSFHSDTMTKNNEKLYSYPVGKSRPITPSISMNSLILDRRVKGKGKFLVRSITHLEKERLFGFEDGYTSVLTKKTHRNDVLGNTVSVDTIKYLLNQLK